jgi:hypothetical protein
MKRAVAMPSPRSPSFFRGLYARVAKGLGFDPSYVSRIARGERRSEIVEKAIRREIDKVLTSGKNISRRSAKHQGKKKTPTKR